MASARPKKELVYSHERLNFPVAGSSDPRISLPDVDLYSNLPIQDSVENVVYDFYYPESGNLLEGSPVVQFKAKESMYFSDLADSYLMFEVSFNKEGADPTIDPTEECSPTNFLSAVLFKDLSIEFNGKPVNSTFGNYMYESYIKLLIDSSGPALDKWEVSE